MTEKIRVILDTQTFLRAAINRGSRTRKVVFDLSDQYQLIFSVEIRKELESVLNRPKIRAKFKQLTDEIINLLSAIFDKAELIELPDEILSVSRDPKDDIFLACAL